MELEKITAGQKDSQENGQAPAQAAAAQKYATAPAIAETSIARVPSLIASPSTRKYKTAITLQNTYDSSCIVLLDKAAPEIYFDETTKKSYIGGENLKKVDLKKLTAVDISDADMTKLQVIYSVIQKKYEAPMTKGIVEKTIDKYSVIGLPITLYVPELLKQMGMTESRNKKQMDLVIRKIMDYQRMVGIFIFNENGRRKIDRYPVLKWLGTSETDGTITFTSPYLNILTFYSIQDAIQLDKCKQPILKKNGLPKLKVSHSYLELTSIAKERSAGAVEIVHVICQLLEETGSGGTPNISAATILKRCPVLECQTNNCLDKNGSPDTKHRNQHLKRTFRKAFELLRTQTRVEEVFKNIQIPDPDDMILPTMQTLETTIYRFPHDGKVKNSNDRKPEKCDRKPEKCDRKPEKCDRKPEKCDRPECDRPVPPCSTGDPATLII